MTLAQDIARARRGLAQWCEQLAHRLDPVPTYTVEITTSAGTQTFVNCRPLNPALR